MRLFDINPKTGEIIEDPDLDFNAKRGWIRVCPYNEFLKKCEKIDKARLQTSHEMNEGFKRILDVLDGKPNKFKRGK